MSVRRATLALDLDAVEARGLALGLRQAWRLRLPSAQIAAWREAFGSVGHSLAVSVPRFALLQGGSLKASGDAEAVHLVVIAPSPATAEACLGDEVSNAARVEGDDPAALARTVAAHRRLGAAYGYPPCCVNAFVDGWLAAVTGQRPDLAENALLILRAHLRSQAWHPLLGGFAAGLGEQSPSPLRHLPCRFDCPPSIDLAERLAADLRQRNPAFADRQDRAPGRSLWLHADGRLVPVVAGETVVGAPEQGPAASADQRLPVLLPFGG